MRTPPGAGPDLDTDLCIIGAGPAGISIASELDRSGVRVCLLESGAAGLDRAAQRHSRGESNGYPIHRLDRSRVRAFGGTLRHPRLGDEGWAARPLDAIDFEVRPGLRDTGWPFTREHLEPYYVRAQRACDLAAYGYQADSWSDPARTPILPLNGSGVDTTMFQFGAPPFQHALDQFAGSPNVRLFLRTRAVELTSDPKDGRVDAVEVCREDGSRFVVRPRIVVLAAGGIENARLLLCADRLRGLGNEYDLVGRFFSERLSMYAGHIVPARPDLPDDAAFYEPHRVRQALVRGALRVCDKVQRDRGLLNCAFFVVARPEAVTTGAVRSLATLRKAAGRRPLPEHTGAHLRAALGGLTDIGGFALSRVTGGRSVLVLRAQGEQAPNRDSRVTLGSARDDLGFPVARVTWRIQDSDRASIRESLELVDAALRANGLGSVEGAIGDEQPPPLIEGNHHHMGTTRMHPDPRHGVLDQHCRVHSVPNLYVAGSSVFPTYGASNPTLTIVALALRLADHLADHLADRPAPPPDARRRDQ